MASTFHVVSHKCPTCKTLGRHLLEAAQQATDAAIQGQNVRVVLHSSDAFESKQLGDDLKSGFALHAQHVAALRGVPHASLPELQIVADFDPKLPVPQEVLLTLGSTNHFSPWAADQISLDRMAALGAPVEGYKRHLPPGIENIKTKAGARQLFKQLALSIAQGSMAPVGKGSPDRIEAQIQIGIEVRRLALRPTGTEDVVLKINDGDLSARGAGVVVLKSSGKLTGFDGTPLSDADATKIWAAVCKDGAVIEARVGNKDALPTPLSVQVELRDGKVIVQSTHLQTLQGSSYSGGFTPIPESTFGEQTTTAREALISAAQKVGESLIACGRTDGYFGIDALVGHDGVLIFSEINDRRTGAWPAAAVLLGWLGAEHVIQASPGKEVGTYWVTAQSGEKKPVYAAWDDRFNQLPRGANPADVYAILEGQGLLLNRKDDGSFAGSVLAYFEQIREAPFELPGARASFVTIAPTPEEAKALSARTYDVLVHALK